MQKVQAVATELSARASEAALDVPAVHPDRALTWGLVGRARAHVERLTDSQFLLGISTVLFALAAWPLALTEVPPYQDLPNHLAAVKVIHHPELYPEFVSNGFLKTNSFFFAWLVLVGKLVAPVVAAKLFALFVLALNALVFPRFVLDVTGSRKKAFVAGFFLWPFVHNWFVSMGMLDFALGVPLSILLLMAVRRQGTKPSLANAGLILAVAAATWYAHVFTLMVAHLLVAIHIVTRPSWADRLQWARRVIPALAPTTALMLWSLALHFTEPKGAMVGFVEHQKEIGFWELGYNLWAEWFWGFTSLSISSMVPSVVLGVLALVAIWRRHQGAMFFSPLALAALAALYLFLPYSATNWFHVNSRIIPYLWLAALVRIPDRLPKPLLGVLGLSAVLYSAGMGADFVRLERDRAKFTAGMSVVPEHARLLPLVFRHKLTSENTRSLLHAWGFYAEAKETSMPLLFAHSRSFPVMYREPPKARFNHLVLESFASTMSSPHWMCDMMRSAGIYLNDCQGEWKARWGEFWQDSLQEFDHVLLWDATPEAKALVPPVYRVKFEQDRLTIYERVAPPVPVANGDAR